MTAEPAGSRPPKTDPEALAGFEALYRAEVSQVMAFFARRSGNPEIVADLTADTFVEAICSFRSYDPALGSPRAWLLGIARRVYAKHCEITVRRFDAARRDGARQVLAADEAAEISERIDAEEHGRRLLERLADMSQGDREAIELVDLAGLTPKQAATTLGLSPGAVRVRLFRARTRLRRERSEDV